MMGWSEAAVGASSLWHFLRAYDGWRRFHGAAEGPKAPSDAEFDLAVLKARGHG